PPPTQLYTLSLHDALPISPVDIVSIEYTDEYDVLSQEFQFISSADTAFNYTAGLYYYKQDANTNRDVVLGNDFVEYFIGPLYASDRKSTRLNSSHVKISYA